MNPLRVITVVDQTCLQLRQGAAEGRWGGRLPPVRALAAELAIAPNTLMAAIRRLEAEGFFKGAGRERRFAATGATKAKAAFRVAILLNTPLEEEAGAIREMFMNVRQRLEKAGRTVIIAGKTQSEPGFGLKRLAPLVAGTPADAWVVIGGGCETLEWFAGQPVPTLAFAGRGVGLPISRTGSNTPEAFRRCLRDLVAQGHRRIVLLGPTIWLKPSPSLFITILREELAAAGITAGDYNSPEWDESPEGLQGMLKSLFRVTPPTAIITAEYEPALGVMSFLAERGLRLPRDLSLITMDDNAALRWHRPALAHLSHDYDLMAWSVLRWVEDVARGRTEPRDLRVDCAFVPGGTVGAAGAGKV